VEEIGHSELVRMHQEMAQAQFRTQQQLSELTIQVAKIATTQAQQASDINRHEEWQAWGIRLALGVIVILFGALGAFFFNAISAS
jgi:hypothetical protein